MRDTLSEQEVHDGLLFTVWRLVVIVMAVQALGYVAPRTIGPRYGLLVRGLSGVARR